MARRPSRGLLVRHLVSETSTLEEFVAVGGVQKSLGGSRRESVCVCEREREREIERVKEIYRERMCVRERERRKHQPSALVQSRETKLAILHGS